MGRGNEGMLQEVQKMRRCCNRHCPSTPGTLIHFFVCPGLLEEDGSENEVKPVQQARMLYHVCLDTGVYCALCTETDQGCKASSLGE